jgi:hypothetical protein
MFGETIMHELIEAFTRPLDDRVRKSALEKAIKG